MSTDRLPFISLKNINLEQKNQKSMKLKHTCMLIQKYEHDQTSSS